MALYVSRYTNNGTYTVFRVCGILLYERYIIYTMVLTHTQKSWGYIYCAKANKNIQLKICLWKSLALAWLLKFNLFLCIIWLCWFFCNQLMNPWFTYIMWIQIKFSLVMIPLYFIHVIHSDVFYNLLYF